VRVARLPVVLATLLLLAAACRQATETSANTSSPTPSPSAPPPSPSAIPPPVASPSPARSNFAFPVDKAMAHVRHLATDLGPRTAGSEAEKAAAKYLEDVFRSFGYEVRRQQFELPQGGTAENIIARHPRVDYSGGYILVGAHFDTVADSPGANDNASGTSVALALAEAFKGRRWPVEFVGFTAEERQPGAPQGALGITHGSRWYALSMKSTDKMLAMLSIDMIGNGSSVLLVRLTGFDPSVRTELNAVAERLNIPHTLSSKGDVSDHAQFARKGIPSAFLYAGHHPSFHKPTDVYEVVRPRSVDWTGRIAGEWLISRLSP
jgi:aminopeptidase YwaD